MNPHTQQDMGKLVLRIALGVLILLHGIAKLKGGMGSIEGMLRAQGLPGFIAYGVYIGEVVAALMVLLGFYARIGALPVLVNMLFAVFLVHMDELARVTGTGGWALELQGMFIATAIAIALLGPGRYSVNGG